MFWRRLIDQNIDEWTQMNHRGHSVVQPPQLLHYEQDGHLVVADEIRQPTPKFGNKSSYHVGIESYSSLKRLAVFSLRFNNRSVITIKYNNFNLFLHWACSHYPFS